MSSFIRCLLKSTSQHNCEEVSDVVHFDLMWLWHHGICDKGRYLPRSGEDICFGCGSLRHCGGVACFGSCAARPATRCPAV